MATPLKRNLKFNESLLECGVCLEVPSSSPIYQCRNGHLYCKECHPKLQECPVCRQGRFQLGNVRCLIAQKILENSKETHNHDQKTSEPSKRPIPNIPAAPSRRPGTVSGPPNQFPTASRNLYCGMCGKNLCFLNFKNYDFADG